MTRAYIEKRTKLLLGKLMLVLVQECRFSKKDTTYLFSTAQYIIFEFMSPYWLRQDLDVLAHKLVRGMLEQPAPKKKRK